MRAGQPTSGSKRSPASALTAQHSPPTVRSGQTVARTFRCRLSLMTTTILCSLPRDRRCAPDLGWPLQGSRRAWAVAGRRFAVWCSIAAVIVGTGSTIVGTPPVSASLSNVKRGTVFLPRASEPLSGAFPPQHERRRWQRRRVGEWPATARAFVTVGLHPHLLGNTES